jgi:hypothetical protein
MRCKKFRQKIVLYFYNELKDKEKTELESHIQECSRCAQEFAQTKKVFTILDETRKQDIPEADWEKNWDTIDSHIRQKPTTQKKYIPFPRWAYAGAALLFILVVGIFIGKFWLPSSGKFSGAPTVSQAYIEHTLKQHLEELKPILIEYANYSASENERDTVVMDKRVAHSLLVQNLLLRNIVGDSHPTLIQLLDDVDLVLKEIANLKKEDKQTPSLVKDLIHEREIIFKVEVLKTL